MPEHGARLTAVNARHFRTRVRLAVNPFTPAPPSIIVRHCGEIMAGIVWLRSHFETIRACLFKYDVPFGAVRLVRFVCLRSYALMALFNALCCLCVLFEK